MQLSKIKMSGFKSFVDPTAVLLPSKMVAVVGPNGCGKSNIIDAVTWVMGESSPKYLRGESLTDVIFNGSSARKPVGQASVELIFDNSDGTIGGEYAQYAEISVKRSINRQSDSSYYLNGARCRKRDIVDIFLGTGLGPRSYSIIGQNMISRIIEAKPDDLRKYLEEAAGISKYKERRHETELRIGHTKDNLERVNDLKSELEKQLTHLKHQANVAEKYKTLKEQERTLRAEWYAIQWRELDAGMVQNTLKTQQEETGLEGRQAEITKLDRDLEQIRHEQRTANDGFQEIQRRYYAVGNEITRIEQDVLHHQERQNQWESDLGQAETDHADITQQIEEAEDALNELQHDIETIEPEFINRTDSLESLKAELESAEENMQDWQLRWDEFNRSAASTSQTVQVEATRMQQVEQRLSVLVKRREQLQDEMSQCNFSELGEEIEALAEKETAANETLSEQKAEMSALKDEISTLQSVQQESNNSLDKLRNELQRFRGQQASLEALQETALGKRDTDAKSWLDKHALASQPRLAQHINVEKGWELAAEKVLGFCLQAVCVDGVEDVINDIDAFKAGNLCLFIEGQAQPASTGNKGIRLVEKINAPWSLDSLLNGIYVADTLEDARHLCKNLDITESVVTRDGVWISPAWLKVLREDDPSAGVFEREQELKKIIEQIEQLEATQLELQNNIDLRKENLKSLEEKREHLQQMINQQQSQTMQVNAQHKIKVEKKLELEQQATRLRADLDSCNQQIRNAEEELAKAQTLWEQASSDIEGHEANKDALLNEREQVRQNLQQTRQLYSDTREKQHELEIRLQTAKSQKSSIEQSLSRLHHQNRALEDRKNTLQSELSSMIPIDTLKNRLSTTLDKHVSIEAEMNAARVSVESLETEFRQLEEKKQIIERDLNKIRSNLELLRLELQGWKVKSDTILEQLQETTLRLEDVLKELPEDATAKDWHAKLEQVVQRINRLGPINLVAIEEYATCLERKEYLDKQTEDLLSGLSTLENAIAKIDKETRTRFKETYDSVNNRFQELFPTVFGGGKAYLELTSDDLLEAGVTLMACPPGKRNSSIYLLSGGEKSLTAIALIFSIFHLNPAPFCMLDEVDAALDDANVLRFTRLVGAMADKTQFIFISHNKITIEMAQHLIGVTMNEPGVSRLVSVDIEKAIHMSESTTSSS